MSPTTIFLLLAATCITVFAATLLCLWWRGKARRRKILAFLLQKSSGMTEEELGKAVGLGYPELQVMLIAMKREGLLGYNRISECPTQARPVRTTYNVWMLTHHGTHQAIQYRPAAPQA